jgi:hypothetical protein
MLDGFRVDLAVVAGRVSDILRNWRTWFFGALGSMGRI